MVQAENKETIKIVLEMLLCPSTSLWRWAWQEKDSVSQHDIRPARQRPRPNRKKRQYEKRKTTVAPLVFRFSKMLLPELRWKMV